MINAYHRFARFPLTGEIGEKYYDKDANKGAAERIIACVMASERLGKILVIGQSGCGKSAVLRHLPQNESITGSHHVISVSASEELNLTDFEPADLLVVIWIKLVLGTRERQIEIPAKTADMLASLIGESTNTRKSDIGLAEALLSKMKADSEFRRNIGKRFASNTELIREHISDLCWILSGQVHAAYRMNEAVLKRFREEDVSQNILARLEGLGNQEYKSELTFLRAIEGIIGDLQTVHYKPVFLKHAWVEEKKDVLIVVDDLNYLRREAAAKLFTEGKGMLTATEAKMVFAFPLSLWHYPIFSDLGSYFHSEFVRPMNIYDASGNFQDTSANILKQAVLKRADGSLISDDALSLLIVRSGGLMGELMRFMRLACLRAIGKNAAMIDYDIATEVIDDRTDTIARLFDFAEYEGAVRTILRSKKKTAVRNEDLVYLLSRGFVTEYGDSADTLWYDAHPCLVSDRKT